MTNISQRERQIPYGRAGFATLERLPDINRIENPGEERFFK